MKNIKETSKYTPESVWQFIQELGEKIKMDSEEFKEQMKELRESQKETDRQMKESRKEIDKELKEAARLVVLVSTYCYTFVKTGLDIIIQLFFISLSIISKHKIKLM